MMLQDMFSCISTAWMHVMKYQDFVVLHSSGSVCHPPEIRLYVLKYIIMDLDRELYELLYIEEKDKRVWHAAFRHYMYVS